MFFILFYFFILFFGLGYLPQFYDLYFHKKKISLKNYKNNFLKIEKKNLNESVDE